MSQDNIMSREETFAMVMAIMQASIANEPFPAVQVPSKKFVRPEDIEDAMDMVTRMIAEKFEQLPKQVSDDFETQEKLQQSIDAMVSKLVLLIRQSLNNIPRI